MNDRPESDHRAAEEPSGPSEPSGPAPPGWPTPAPPPEHKPRSRVPDVIATLVVATIGASVGFWIGSYSRNELPGATIGAAIGLLLGWRMFLARINYDHRSGGYHEHAAVPRSFMDPISPGSFTTGGFVYMLSRMGCGGKSGTAAVVAGLIIWRLLA